MSLASTTIRINGTAQATEIAPHSPPTWETRAAGGHGEASFAFGRSAKFASHLLRPGALLEIFVGAGRVWCGRLFDFDRESGQVIGRGIHEDGNGIPALSSTGNATRNLVTAFDLANPEPWRFPVNRGGNTGVAVGDSTDPMMVWPLVELIAEQTGRLAYVDPDYRLFISPPPTTPTWTLAPDVAAFGQTSESQSTGLMGRYKTDDTSPTLTTIRPNPLPSGARVETVDLTSEGAMTGTQANAILDAMLAGRSQTGWVNGVELHREQITRNGTPAFLPAVHARSRMVRAQGIPVLYGAMQATWLDVQLGMTKYTAGSDTIYLEPVQKAPRTVAEVNAAL